MAGDIEAFLRMAAERRRQAQGGQGGGPPLAKPTPAPPPPAQRPAPRTPLTTTLSPSDPAPRGGIRQPQATEPEVDPYAQASDLPQRAKPGKQKAKDRSGSRTVAPADKPRFKPSVEPASQQPGDSEPYATKPHVAVAAETLTANQIVQLLKNPNSIASAIVLSEILKPIDFE